MLFWLLSSSRAHGSALDTSGACRKTGRGCWTDPTRGCVTSTPQAKYRPLLRHFFGSAFRTHRMVHSAHCAHEQLKARAAALAPVLIDRHRTQPPKTQRAASRRGPELPPPALRMASACATSPRLRIYPYRVFAHCSTTRGKSQIHAGLGPAHRQRKVRYPWLKKKASDIGSPQSRLRSLT